MTDLYVCPFDDQRFNSHETLEQHIESRHISLGNSPLFLTDPELSPQNDELSFPTHQSDPDLSPLISSLNLPENPLSNIGKLSDKSVLKMAKANHVGDVYVVNHMQLNLENQGIQNFQSNETLSLCRFFNLKMLVISRNYLTDLKGISECTNLKELNASHNFLEDLSPLVKLRNLKVLKLNNNRIKDISQLRFCRNLIQLSTHSNLLFFFERILFTLEMLPELSRLKIHNNPFYNIKEVDYFLVAKLNLEELNGQTITYEDKQKALTSLESDSFRKLFRRASHEEQQTEHKAEVEKSSIIQLKNSISQLKEENSRMKTELKKAWKLLEILIDKRQ